VLSEKLPPPGSDTKHLLRIFNEDVWTRINDAKDYKRVMHKDFPKKEKMPKVDENHKRDNAKFQFPESDGLDLLVTLNGEGASNVKYEGVCVGVDQPGVQSPEVVSTRPPSSSSSLSLDRVSTTGNEVFPQPFVR